MVRAYLRTPRPGVFGPRVSAFVACGILVLLLGCGGGSGGSPEGAANTDSGLDGIFVTQPGYAACQEEDRFHEMVRYIAEQQSEAYRALLEDSTSGCFPLNGGVEVEVLTWNVTWAEIQPVGTSTSVWTVGEAVQRRDPPGDSAPETPSPEGP
jgi:hypothetical protein